MHCVVDGHATPATESIGVGVGVPGEAGLNVTTLPLLATAVHWLTDGHATSVNSAMPSIVDGVGVPGEVGLNVTCCPLSSTAVHCVVDGHATLFRVFGSSILVGSEFRERSGS